MSFYSGVYLVRFRIQYFIHTYRGEVGFIQYSKQLTSLVVAQPRYNVLKVKPITGISHQVISPGLFLSSSPSSPLGKKRLGRQKFSVLIILARISSFVTEKISWDQKKRGHVNRQRGSPTSCQYRHRQANQSQFFLWMVRFALQYSRLPNTFIARFNITCTKAYSISNFNFRMYVRIAVAKSHSQV